MSLFTKLLGKIQGADTAASGFTKPIKARAPRVRVENGDARVVEYDDNSLGALAAKRNFAMIYGSGSTPKTAFTRNVIEVKDNDGTWKPVNQINPAAPIGEQIAAFQGWQQSQQVEGGGGVTAANMPGAELGIDNSQALDVSADANPTQFLTSDTSNELSQIMEQGFALGKAQDKTMLTRPMGASGPTGPEGSFSINNQSGASRGGFASSDGANNRASSLKGTIGEYADAIAHIESAGSGNYGAMGDVIPSGKYAGDRALGRYQIMSRNLPEWSQAALGHEITPQEFMANPHLQDQIFAHRFGQMVETHGNAQDAASVWFTGRTIAAGGGNAKDLVTGLSGNGYVNKFNDALMGVQKGSVRGGRNIEGHGNDAGRYGSSGGSLEAPANSNGAYVTYANGGAQRNLKLTGSLQSSISGAVDQVFGPGYSARVTSGGQNQLNPFLGRSRGMVGSSRHNGGKAGDIEIVDPDGNVVNDDRLGRLAQHWLANEKGSVGLVMRGGRIHLDEHKDRGKNWDYMGQGGSITKAQRSYVDDGLSGIDVTPARGPDPTTAPRPVKKVGIKDAAKPNLVKAVDLKSKPVTEYYGYHSGM